MSSSHDRRRLDQLRADLYQALEPVLHGTSFVLSRRRPGRDVTGASPRTEGASGSLGVRTTFPGDERRIRALAKQIKRLITEDNRRGIGV